MDWVSLLYFRLKALVCMVFSLPLAPLPLGRCVCRLELNNGGMFVESFLVLSDSDSPLLLGYPSRRKLDVVLGTDFMPPGSRVPRYHFACARTDPHAKDHPVRVYKKTVIPPATFGYCWVRPPSEPSDFFGTQVH